MFGVRRLMFALLALSMFGILEQIEYLKAENAILKKLDALIQERKNPKPSKS